MKIKGIFYFKFLMFFVALLFVFLGNRTCSEIKYCNPESGSYVIDPVREGAVKPFKVSLTIPHGNGACPCPRLKKRARACSVIS